MSLLKSLREMDQRFSWSFLGFMVAIIIGSVTLYIEFIKENKPDLNYIITSNTSVLDIRENLGSLDVLYQGDSLSKNRKDLRLITFEVINQGDTAILSNFYDSNDPVGFSVIDGKIADEPTLIEASNSYLENKLAIEKVSETSVVFSNVILEPNASFKIKILVLHDLSKKPTIKAFGKVAGVDNIDVFLDFTSGNKRSFIEETFGGGFYPNITRFISFGITFILAIILLIVTTDKIGDLKDKRRKNKLIQVFKEYDTEKISEKDNFFFDYYLSFSASTVKKLFDLLSDQTLLNELAQHPENSHSKELDSHRFYNDAKLFNELLSEGFIKVENEIVVVDPDRYSVLTDFFNFLKRKGEFRRGMYVISEHREINTEIESSSNSNKPCRDNK